VINAGSSSLKCTVFQMPQQRALATCLVERIGEREPFLSYKSDAASGENPCRVGNHREALKAVIDVLLAPDAAVISDLEEISAVGHRVVHGGEQVIASTSVDETVLEAIRDNSKFAPLHNPSNLAAIQAAMELLPGKVQVAVFDTAFHSSMPPRAYLYAIPYELYEQHHLRRYGFHGISYRYVAERAAHMLSTPLEQCNLIVFHLGNGCSAAAIKGGVSIDTSMGFTPLEGLPMGTRSGDIDPALPFFLMEILHTDASAINEMLNRRSGLLGLSGVSNDMRDVLAAAERGVERAERALDVFCYRIKKYLGAYLAVLGRADGIVFTAGIGENHPVVRSKVCEGLETLGIRLDPQKNEKALGREALIHSPESQIAVMVIPTNEALKIALDTYQICMQRRTNDEDRTV